MTTPNEALLKQAFDDILHVDPDNLNYVYQVRKIASDAAIAQPEQRPEQRPEQPIELPINHAEAKSLAYLKRQESNLARCYLELCEASQPEQAVEPTAQPVGDAERYRFLDHQCRAGTYSGIISREAIDAAIAASKVEPAQPESKA